MLNNSGKHYTTACYDCHCEPNSMLVFSCIQLQAHSYAIVTLLWIRQADFKGCRSVRIDATSNARWKWFVLSYKIWEMMGNSQYHSQNSVADQDIQQLNVHKHRNAWCTYWKLSYSYRSTASGKVKWRDDNCFQIQLAFIFYCFLAIVVVSLAKLSLNVRHISEFLCFYFVPTAFATTANPDTIKVWGRSAWCQLTVTDLNMTQNKRTVGCDSHRV